MTSPIDPSTPALEPQAGGGLIGLSVVVPMFREARRIGATLADLVPTLQAGPELSEVILVDDGSDDQTSAVVQPWLTEAPVGALQRVRLIRHPRNRGKGAAVRTGLAHSNGQWRLLMDADNACRVRELTKLRAESARSGAALVVGSRRAPGALVESRLSRRLAGLIFRTCLGFLGLSLARDTQCGFKLYSADLADLIAGIAREDGFAFDLEHLLIARRSGLGIAEVGVRWTHVDGGTVRPIRDGLRMLGRAVAIRRRHFHPLPSLAAAQIEAKPVGMAAPGGRTKETVRT
jgi:dolichyl-phosphate beta-glucosyltransferase